MKNLNNFKPFFFSRAECEEAREALEQGCALELGVLSARWAGVEELASLSRSALSGNR